MAKEQYADRLKDLLFQTIEYGTNVDKMVKICHLIEKCAHLKSIYDQLKYLIERVYQLNIDKKYSAEKIQPIRNSAQHSHSLKIQCDQSLHSAVWPTMLQPSCVESFKGFLNLNFDCYGYGRPAFDFLSSLNNSIAIVDQDMDGPFAKWLHYLRLHKYQWFFNCLSYHEIERIDEENIEAFISKVNRNSISKGAQKKICLSTKLLRDREKKLGDLSMSLDLEVTPNELCEYMTYMKEILHYPIPNKHCVVGDQLQQAIVIVMEKLLMQLLEKLSTIHLLVAQSLIGSSINKFLECTMLIIGNQTFMKEQVEKTSDYAKKLKYQVRQIPKDFN